MTTTLTRTLKIPVRVLCVLSLTVFMFALPGMGVKAHAHLCGSGFTYNTATFDPAPSKYANIVAIACGVGSGTFTTEHHQIECSTSSPSSDWSFGTGYYEYYAYSRSGSLVYDHRTNISSSCPNNTALFGSVGAFWIFTDFQLNVTYLPTNNQTALFAEALDCAAYICPH